MVKANIFLCFTFESRDRRTRKFLGHDNIYIILIYNTVLGPNNGMVLFSGFGAK